MRAVRLSLEARAHLMQRQARKGVDQNALSAWARRPGCSIHDGNHIRNDSAGMAQLDCHGVKVILQHRAHAAFARFDPDSAPVTGKREYILNRDSNHDAPSQSRARGVTRSFHSPSPCLIESTPPERPLPDGKQASSSHRFRDPHTRCPEPPSCLRLPTRSD
jgi:hypothetical protein